MSLKVHLLVIDPQDSFMDIPDSSLPVAGANNDMKRVAALINRVGHRLEDVHVTLDSHRVIDVGHSGMWRNEAGEQPGVYTRITADDIKNRIWTPRNLAYRPRLYNYARSLEAAQKYQIMVWPEHCKIGTRGHNVQADLAATLEKWERKEFANVDYVTKGTNPFTEHYGALMAEVPDPEDSSTQLNTKFLEVLASADIIAVAGEALSHCVKATLEQVVANIGAEHVKKFQILTDCCSPVAQPPGGPDFPAIGRAFLQEMESLGMKLSTSTEFLA